MRRPNFISEDELKVLLGNMNTVRGSTDARSTTGNGSRRDPAIQKTTSRRGESAPSRLFFLIPGQAMGKPRMTQRDKWKKRPVVLRYRAWCDAARASVGCMEKTTLIYPVKMTVLIFLSCPASWSRKKQLEYNGRPHTGKPDVDNVVKGVMDALFTNDSFVFKVMAEKYWTESNPHTAVTIDLVEA